MDIRVHRTRMTPIERIDADLFRFNPLSGERASVVRRESPLCFIETKAAGTRRTPYAAAFRSRPSLYLTRQFAITRPAMAAIPYIN